MNTTILLVEDDADARDTIKSILEESGYNIIPDNTGDSVFKYIEEHVPSLIILDIFLPQHDGRDICKQLKEHPVYNHIPVIMISGHAEIYNTINYFGANDVITKPFDTNTLKTRVSRQLSNNRPPQVYEYE